MLNSTEKNKIKRFLADKVMADTIEKIFLASFLKKSGNTDVQTLAAERIAINLLEEGFKDLRKYANQITRDEKQKGQIAL
jgi:hypothetical protein